MSKVLNGDTWKRIIWFSLVASVLIGNLPVVAAPGTQNNIETRISEAVALFHNRQIPQAVGKFRGIGDPAVPAVMELLKTDVGSRGMPLLLLTGFFSSTKGARADAALIELLSKESPYLRGFAASLIGKRKLRVAVPHLIKLLDDKEVYITTTSSHYPDMHTLVRDEAIDALQSITGKTFARNKSRGRQAEAWLEWWREQKEWK